MDDFLAREQEILGSDNIFSNETPITTSAAIVDDIESPEPPIIPSINTIVNANVVNSADNLVSPVVQEWKNTFKQLVATRDSNSKSKHSNTLETAKESLSTFYQQYNQKKQQQQPKNIPTTGNIPPLTSANVWENTLKIIDQIVPIKSANAPANASADKKRKETSGRMKQLLSSLAKDKHAPGIY